MQGLMKFTYLGIDEYIGKKDPSKKYYSVNLLQGSEIAKIFLDQGQEILFRDMTKFDDLEATVAFSLGTDRYGAKINYKLLSVKPLMPEIPFEEVKPADSTIPINQKVKTG